MLPRKKLSGAQFRKAKIQKQMVSHQSKEFMKNFIGGNNSRASRSETNSSTVESSIGDSSFTDGTTDNNNMVIVTTMMILVNFLF